MSRLQTVSNCFFIYVLYTPAVGKIAKSIYPYSKQTKSYVKKYTSFCLLLTLQIIELFLLSKLFSSLIPSSNNANQNKRAFQIVLYLKFYGYQLFSFSIKTRLFTVYRIKRAKRKFKSKQTSDRATRNFLHQTLPGILRQSI